jgi:hypothetical protein
MPSTEILRNEIYETVNGVTTLIEVIETEIEVQTQEEIIAEKEAKLLEMYAELNALKEQI